MGFGTYDKEGRPIDTLEWGKLSNDRKYKVVKQTTLPNGTWVSTVWLGLDYNFSDEGPPIIFETMVFPKYHNWDNLECERYSTEEEARYGHQRMIEKWLDKKR